MKRPLVLIASKYSVFGTPESHRALEDAHDQAWATYQELMESEWDHKDALIHAQACLVGAMTALFNIMAEEVKS
jgi:hypothetical protein